MILDTLAHSAQYAPLHPLFPAAFAWLAAFDPATPDGKYEIDGVRLYAAVQRYETAPEPTKAWETHRVYGDIQFIVAGREKILHTPAAELQGAGGKKGSVTIPYNPAKDVEKYSGAGVKNSSSDILAAGSFAIYYPQDGHKPGCFVEMPEPILKVVIKFRMEG